MEACVFGKHARCDIALPKLNFFFSVFINMEPFHPLKVLSLPPYGAALQLLAQRVLMFTVMKVQQA